MTFPLALRLPLATRVSAFLKNAPLVLLAPARLLTLRLVLAIPSPSLSYLDLCCCSL